MPRCSLASHSPQAYWSAMPEWLPLFLILVLDEAMPPSSVYLRVFWATTFERPRGTSRNGTRSA